MLPWTSAVGRMRWEDVPVLIAESPDPEAMRRAFEVRSPPDQRTRIDRKAEETILRPFVMWSGSRLRQSPAI